jgi:signal transduction histidine kinase
VAAAAVVLFAVPLAAVLARSYRDAELVRLQRDTTAATLSIGLGARRDPIELPKGKDVLGVYDGTGRRIAGRGPAHADPLVRSALRAGRAQTRMEPGHLLAAVPVVANERVAGAVRAVRGDGEVAEQVHRAWLALAGLAAALVLAAALAALALGRRLARPLEDVAAAAERLGEGDFGVRPRPTGIPEVDAVAAALDATAERLNDLVARERAFSADASHQLRTPLAALRLELEALQLRDDSAEVDAAVEQVDRLQTTIDVLLSVARDAPRREVEADLRVLLDEAEQRWRGALAAEGRPLRTLVRAEDPVAAASPAVIGEVLDVLLANAARHGAGPVTATVRAIDGWLALDVADEGPGFSGDPETAFGRRSETADGHGIGLALARALAHAEGGRLAVTTAARHPVLTLTLPRARAREKPATAHR